MLGIELNVTDDAVVDNVVVAIEEYELVTRLPVMLEEIIPRIGVIMLYPRQS